MHFYEDLYSPPMTLVMREMAVPHALPMVFGDLSYEASVGGKGRRAHCLALGMDDDYVYFGVVPTELGELPGRTVRVCREHAAELGSISSPSAVRRSFARASSGTYSGSSNGCGTTRMPTWRPARGRSTTASPTPTKGRTPMDYIDRSRGRGYCANDWRACRSMTSGPSRRWRAGWKPTRSPRPHGDGGPSDAERSSPGSTRSAPPMRMWTAAAGSSPRRAVAAGPRRTAHAGAPPTSTCGRGRGARRRAVAVSRSPVRGRRGLPPADARVRGRDAPMGEEHGGLLRLGFGALDEKEARRWSTPPSL